MKQDYIPRILLWGAGLGFLNNYACIKLQEFMGTIEIVGITDKNEYYEQPGGYQYVPPKDICKNKIEYIVVTTNKFYQEIRKEAVALGFLESHILPIKVFQYPFFDFKKYVELIESKVTIIANNCWGGITYHLLGMEFNSPFINMYVKDDDYMRMLKNIKHYLSLSPVFLEWAYNSDLDRNYPVCSLGDIKLFFNHYVDMEEVNRKWHSRCERINWDNLFVMMYTDREEIAEMFDMLPFEKKICFTSFESNLQSTFPIPKAVLTEDKPLFTYVNQMASGHLNLYNPIKLLLGDF